MIDMKKYISRNVSSKTSSEVKKMWKSKKLRKKQIIHFLYFVIKRCYDGVCLPKNLWNTIKLCCLVS